MWRYDQRLALNSVGKRCHLYHSSCLISPEDPKMVVRQERFCTLADLGEGTETVQADRDQAQGASWQALVLGTERNLGPSGRVTLHNHTVASQWGPCQLTATLQECSRWCRILKATPQSFSRVSSLWMLLSVVDVAPTETWLVSGSQHHLVCDMGTSALASPKGKVWGSYLASASKGSAKAPSPLVR